MNLARVFLSGARRALSSGPPAPLRSRKGKSLRRLNRPFNDSRSIVVFGGNGGDGKISFLRLWVNDHAGPDGGDGGNGGHVLFEASNDVKDLSHMTSIIKAEHGERGYNKDCNGKNADHTVVKVPVGTIIKTKDGDIVSDLKREGCLFIAARGGAGGKGNHYFVSSTNQSPQVAEYGALGEELGYHLEIRSMAHMGLIGFPNAGKSSLLSAITRAGPKVASYAFTTLQPNVGTIHYEDYEQIVIADLPGLIPESHLNRGLGIQFLKHVERCCGIIFLIDVSLEEPWLHYETLLSELKQYNEELLSRPKLIVANKMDLPESKENLTLFQEKIKEEIIPISAKTGINLSKLLEHIRKLYDISLKDLKP